MTRTERTLVLTGITVLTSGLFAGLTGCRTSQESRRGVAASRAQAGSPLAQQLDSMHMIQEKLVEVIDSLTALASADRDRIHSLETDLSMVRSRIEGTPLPAPPRVQEEVIPPPPILPKSYTAPPPASIAPTPSTNPPEASQPAEISDRYDAALRLFRQNNFEAALAAFQKLEDDDPTGTYGPNYKYWQGESLYALKQYDRALREFQNVADEYPHTNKAEPSEFKLGECYERLGRTSIALAAYERLLADFPNSEYRARATARIAALQSAH